ncbi:MAG: hypothetical protein GF401_14535 [Chitinivibrionales bacterium]|nr:hypothetical protein [Chitinivibrionales bacterium]
MKRVGDNPPARYPERPIAGATDPWWIAKLRPRQEKALAVDCIKRDIEYYLPFYTKTVRRKDNNKPRKSVLPLFPGYISYTAPPGFQQDIFKTGRVVKIIEVKHQKRLIKELGQIYRCLEENAPLEPVETFVTGDVVQIKSGPLRGVTGVVAKIQNVHKLVLTVEGLGRAAMVVDAADLRSIK